MKRRCAIIGNWKMYKTAPEAVEFVEAMKGLLPKLSEGVKVYLAVPYTAIRPVADSCSEDLLVIGAQNMNDASKGAFTGEIAARMVVDAGAHFVVLGHSERRTLFAETDALVNRKVQQAFKEGIEPIVCIGESLEERESGRTTEVLREQLLASLKGTRAKNLDRFMIAYEPVWAIGTGKAATPTLAQETHQILRQIASEKWGTEVGENLPILYGGSVREENAHALVEQPDIDGLLVGGASLEAEVFAAIVKQANLALRGHSE